MLNQLEKVGKFTKWVSCHGQPVLPPSSNSSENFDVVVKFENDHAKVRLYHLTLLECFPVRIQWGILPTKISLSVATHGQLMKSPHGISCWNVVAEITIGSSIISSLDSNEISSSTCHGKQIWATYNVSKYEGVKGLHWKLTFHFPRKTCKQKSNRDGHEDVNKLYWNYIPPLKFWGQYE